MQLIYILSSFQRRWFSDSQRPQTVAKMGVLNGINVSSTLSFLANCPYNLVSLSSSTLNLPIPRITSKLTNKSSSHFHSLSQSTTSRTFKPFASLIAAGNLEEVLPPALDSSSDPIPVFDGTTRLYICYKCPYAQRVWITRNCKGLQDKIELVPINLQDRPAWYKEKVNPANKVPALEHKNEIIVESLDLIKYIDSNFEGPNLSPSDPNEEEFAEEMFSYTNSFIKSVKSSFKEENVNNETSAAFDYLETALGMFEDGPFILGEFSMVDIAYAPFIERYKAFLLDVKNYDIVVGRPRLGSWIEQMDKITAYKSTQRDPKELVEALKRRLNLS